MDLDEWLIEHKEATYLLKVKGDSMRDAWILEGDFVLVERTHDAKVGQIVVADVEGEWTVKYLMKEKGRFALVPANDDFETIYPRELSIAAVVRSVIRRYDYAKK
jgi:SOS-response transcriptional repressor LexA